MFLAEVNGVCCTEARLLGLEIEIETPLANVIGSDLLGIAHSSMRLSDFALFSQTSSFVDRFKRRDYFKKEYERFTVESGRKPGGLEFIGNKFMYSEGHPRFVSYSQDSPRSGDMVQHDSSRKPIRREDE